MHRIQLHHRGTGIARLQQAAQLGGVGFQHPGKGRADFQPGDVALHGGHRRLGAQQGGAGRFHCGNRGGDTGFGCKAVLRQLARGAVIDFRLGQTGGGFGQACLRLGQLFGAGAGVKAAQHVARRYLRAPTQRFRHDRAAGFGAKLDHAGGLRLPARQNPAVHRLRPAFHRDDRDGRRAGGRIGTCLLRGGGDGRFRCGKRQKQVALHDRKIEKGRHDDGRQKRQNPHSFLAQDMTRQQGAGRNIVLIR